MGIIGGSPEIEKCLSVVADAAESEKEVLIVGESGTGKELFARAVHENNKRASGPFIVVDCAALPETLAESTLFGHEKGAFTSAGMARAGLVGQADGGILFLDEIGELPLTLQKTFLRVVQEKTYRPLGAQRELRSDFRLVAAANRDLDQMVREGLFREDLLFRIKSWVIALPPLRERSGDVVEIAINFVSEHSKRAGCGIKGLSPEFVGAITAYPWPGNVRELLMALETATDMSRDEPVLYHYHLPAHVRVQVARAAFGKHQPSGRASTLGKTPIENFPSFKKFRTRRLFSIEHEYFQELMRVTAGDIKRACKISGLSRSHLYRLLREQRLTEAG